MIPFSGHGNFTYAQMRKVFASVEMRSEREFMDWWKSLSSDEQREMLALSEEN